MRANRALAEYKPHRRTRIDEPKAAMLSPGSGEYSSAFPLTHWSVVLAAGNAPSPEAHNALERLCCTYWYPLYAFIRRQGYGVEEAKDLVQGFFQRLLARDSLKQANRDRGRRSPGGGVLPCECHNSWMAMLRGRVKTSTNQFLVIVAAAFRSTHLKTSYERATS